ncbi:hypothetical protein DRI96_03405, partial [Candidatus Aerophobetes bacterium]
ARQKEASLGIPRSPLNQIHQIDETDETDVFQGSPEIFPETGVFQKFYKNSCLIKILVKIEVKNR